MSLLRNWAARAANFSLRDWIAQGAAVLLVAWIVYLLWKSSVEMTYNWQWYRVPGLMLPNDKEGEWNPGPLLSGLRLTFLLALAGAPLAAAVGLALALMGKSRLFTLRWISRGYIEVVRNTPMLVQLYLLYFLIASIFSIDRVLAGLVALVAFEAAFAAEIFRAGLDAVSRGQLDAARSLGVSRWQALRLIALPQSLPLILPPLANLFVALIKHSSLVSVVAIPELTDQARNVIADTYMTFEIWLVVAAVYVILCYLFSQAIGIWERRLIKRTSRRLSQQ